MPRTLGRRVGQGVADQHHQPDLEDPQEQGDQDDQHQHEVHDRGPALRPAADPHRLS